jgi:energy-converting hydrogenase Eha subunit E
MAGRSKNYIWQSVIVLGFLSGLWTSVGVDPEQVVIGALGTAFDTIYPDPNVRYLFILLPTILLLFSIYSAYSKGKVLGLISVVAAYCAGLLVLQSTAPALLLLLGAVFIGWLATNRRLIKKLAGH